MQANNKLIIIIFRFCSRNIDDNLNLIQISTIYNDSTSLKARTFILFKNFGKSEKLL